jgi:hypothetical protein
VAVLDRRRSPGAVASRMTRGNYLAGCLPGRRRILRAPRIRAQKNMTMPIISRYNKPFATTPTVPSIRAGAGSAIRP